MGHQLLDGAALNVAFTPPAAWLAGLFLHPVADPFAHDARNYLRLQSLSLTNADFRDPDDSPCGRQPWPQAVARLALLVFASDLAVLAAVALIWVR